MISSCSEEKVESDKVSNSDALRSMNFLSKYSRNAIAEASELDSADIGLFCYFETENVLNTHVLPPGTRVGAFLIATNLDDIKSVSLNTDALKKTSPLIYPGYFYSPSNWTTDNHVYGAKSNWEVLLKDLNIPVNTDNQNPVYRVYLNSTDTFKISKPLEIRWNKDTINRTGNKVYISFTWYPSFKDTQYSKEYPGFSSEDSGIYLPSVATIKALNLPDFGVLQVNVLRYNTKLTNVLGKKIFIANMVEAHSSVYIGK